MKKIVLAIALITTMVQAENVVHYDKKVKKEKTVSKPNHPNNDIHVIKK